MGITAGEWMKKLCGHFECESEEVKRVKRGEENWLRRAHVYGWRQGYQLSNVELAKELGVSYAAISFRGK